MITPPIALNLANYAADNNPYTIEYLANYAGDNNHNTIE